MVNLPKNFEWGLRPNPETLSKGQLRISVIDFLSFSSLPTEVIENILVNMKF